MLNLFDYLTICRSYTSLCKQMKAKCVKELSRNMNFRKKIVKINEKKTTLKSFDMYIFAKTICNLSIQENSYISGAVPLTHTYYIAHEGQYFSVLDHTSNI